MDSYKYRKNNDRLIFNVRTDMRNQVIRSCHDEMWNIGENITIEFITQVYWFPELTEHVKNNINSCFKCNIFSPKKEKGKGLLNLIDEGNKPF